MKLRTSSAFGQALLCGIFIWSSFSMDARAYREIRLETGWEILKLENGRELKPGEVPDLLKQEGWIKVERMPSQVPDILLANGIIEEPWLPGRAASLQWIAESDWLYATTLEPGDPAGASYLEFGGLDGIVDVYLNGELLASHQNMYLPLRVAVSGKLEPENSLVLHFRSVYDLSGEERKPLKRFRGKPVRRPDQNYLNYLGPFPNFSRVGVFGDIVLAISQGTEITSLLAGSSLNDALDLGVVDLRVKGESAADRVALEARILDPGGRVVASEKADLEAGEGHFTGSVSLRVQEPLLWWPRGYGDQPLYRAEVRLLTGGKVHQTLHRRLGFRKVEMSDTLHFLVNHRPVRLWGGCWVSPDWKTTVWNRARAERLFDLAENANFNALRVWGVVEAPDDHFYELADERGFMLWQDFTELPLGPGEESVEICRNESAYLIRRLKHHPSVFVWCGGNENAMWHHQEFNAPLEDRGDWPGLVAAMEVEKVCRELDPERYFQPTSPYYGIDPNDPQHGNTHGYTNLWYIPGYDYLNFASEDTRIAAPVLQSLERFMAPEDIYPEDYSPLYLPSTTYPFPESWLEYTTSTSWKKTGPVEQFYDHHDAASLVQRLGMAEAQYYRETVERQRRGRPATEPDGKRRCGGYLVWKFNDSWPQVYSAKVDYFLEPYHSYYALKQAFSPVHISFEQGTYIYLWVVNDSPGPVAGELRIQLWHLDRNEVRKEIRQEVSLDPDESLVALRLDTAGIGTFTLQHILSATLTGADGKILARTYGMPDIERRMSFPDAKLRVHAEGDELVITTDKFARTVCISGDAAGDSLGWFFSDNYFDLLPGERKRVRILGEHREGTLILKPWYSGSGTTLEWKNINK